MGSVHFIKKMLARDRLLLLQFHETLFLKEYLYVMFRINFCNVWNQELIILDRILPLSATIIIFALLL